MPKVSVLMPSYNVAPYIRQSIDSVLGQTLQDIEVICIDAGSEDGTAEIISEMAKEDSRLIVLPSERKSYGFQMNLGIKKARGEYIAIVETDDFADADMLERLCGLADACEADLVKSNYWEYRNGRDFFHETLAGHPYDRVICPCDDDPSLLKVSPSIWSAVYRRSVLLEQGVYFLETPGAAYQDVSFAIKALAVFRRVVLCREAFLHYRRDNAAQSVRDGGKSHFLFDEFQVVEDFLAQRPELEKKLSEAIRETKHAQFLTGKRRLVALEQAEFLIRVKEELQREAANGEAALSLCWQQLMENTDEQIRMNAILQWQEQKMCVSGFWRELEGAGMIYLYGAGRVACLVKDCLAQRGFAPAGFLVTSLRDKKEMEGIPLFEASRLPLDCPGILVLACVGDEKLPEVLGTLRELHCSNYIAMNLELRQSLGAE